MRLVAKFQQHLTCEVFLTRVRCFLPSFSSFGWGVSEEKIKMWKVNGRRTPGDGKSSHCLWQGELKYVIYANYQIITKIAHFVPIRSTNMDATGNSCFWLADFKKSSPLKPLGQMNRNLIGNIYGRSSIKIAHFVSFIWKAVSEEKIF
jgi:hypothetical protein